MTAEDERDVVAQLLEVAELRGIKPLEARRFILKATNKHELLRKWRAAYALESARAIKAAEDRELDKFAEKAWDRHRVIQERTRGQLRSQRATMRLGQRLDLVLAQVELAPGLATPDFVPSGDHTAESVEPPSAEALDFTAHLAVIRSRVEAIEAEWDAFRGYGPARNWAMASGDDKDKEILSSKWRGIHSREVAEAAPWLGSERTIRRVRAESGLNTSGEERVKSHSRGQRDGQ